MTQQYYLASMAAWFSSTSISHYNLLSPVPSGCLHTVFSRPHPGFLHNPYTPVPSRCTFQGTSIPVWGMYGSGKDCLILIPFTLPQISCFTLSLKCFSSDSDIAPMVGIRPLLQFLHQVRASPVLLTLLFFPLVPLSYQVLHGSIYYFPLVRYSCPLSAGVQHTLLCLKVYS